MTAAAAPQKPASLRNPPMRTDADPIRIETFDSLDLGSLGKPVHVCVGTFDGVHLGHRALLDRLASTAHADGALAAIFTFQNHPRAIVHPESVPAVLTPWHRKAELLAETGCDVLIGLPFTEEFSHIAPDAFVREVLCGRCAAKRIVSGGNFRFGFKGEGSPATLRNLSAELGYAYSTEEPVLECGSLISSTRIREELAHGHVAEAARMLGRPHRIEGIVERGDQRGRQIGFPTANLAIAAGTCVPADGVYAVRAHVGNETWPGMMNIGVRPTFRGRERTHEVHIVGFTRDIYGETISVDFAARLRDEVRFAGVDELVAQLRRDRDAALAALAPVGQKG